MSVELLSLSNDSDRSPVSELDALSTTPVGVAVTSLAGSLHFANQAFGGIFGVDVVEHVGGDIRQITRGLLREDFLTPVAREGGPRQTCVADGPDRILLCTATRVMHGKFPIYLSLVVQDISDLASEYRERWQVARGALGAHGIRGPWNWVMRIAKVDDPRGNPVAWLSPDDVMPGARFEPKTFNDLIQRMAPDCRQRMVAEISRAIQTRSDYSVDYELLNRDGSSRRMRSVGRYVHCKQLSEARLIGLEFELPVGQADDRDGGTYSALLEDVEVPIAAIDRQLRYRYFNPAFSVLARSANASDPRVGQPVLGNVADPVRRRRIAEVLSRAMNGEPSVFVSELVDERGEISQWIDLHVKPIYGPSGDIDGAVAVGYDVSPLKRANLHLQTLNARFKQRLEQRTAKIDAANRDLSSRVASACERLRLELQRIKDCVGNAATVGTDSLQRIPAALANMESAIDGLAELSSIGLRRPEPRKIDVNRLLREIRHDLEHMLVGRSIEFDVASLPHVVADRTLLRQVFYNLLDNAIKFTRRCAHARIRVWTVEQDGTTVWSVADNGIGFDMKDADEMFNAFVRRGTKPRGCGLSIAWRAIQQLNGRLWCESEVGQGATFHFTIGDREPVFETQS